MSWKKWFVLLWGMWVLLWGQRTVLVDSQKKYEALYQNMMLSVESPIVTENAIIFFFKGDAESVSVSGDFNQWGKPLRMEITRGSLFFTEEDIRDYVGFMNALYDEKNQLSRYLMEKFSKKTHTIMRELSIPLTKNKKQKYAFSDLKQSLIQDMNQIIQGPILYNPVIFKGVKLSEETQSMLSRSLKEKERWILNRRLIEEAYADYIVPNNYQFILWEVRWTNRLAPGRYRYRLMVDGVWISDPYNTQKVVDMTGVEFSYFDLDREFLPNVRYPLKVSNHVYRFYYKDDEAKTVSLVGDFNNWDPYSLPMVYKGAGEYEIEVKLRPGIHVYCFVVDGKWVPDPQNRYQYSDLAKNTVNLLWVEE
ncbi:hypothetical protein [Thermospira aquatica]|uniref:AMP-activated protein kinase glycogen-binding domain-containing protein n=1 Tax=Thermospira aquatica TaxID=2828656 RepID=A0AAX3BBT2_9SPIR|nr:hypothetical protein [Thermospira aquatica]URA09526.1 hypothetical protein KDW03_08510 [Thermospira aquatica]